MPPNSDNKTTIRMLAVNHDDSVNRATQIDIRSFRSRDTLLDVTKAGFGADNVKAPYKESEFEGVRVSGHEVTQIGDLKKFYDLELNPHAERDGFQAYFVVVSNGQTEKAGLPLEVKDGQKEFLSADGTTVEKLKEIIDKLPEGAELVVVWRRDVEKTKDVTYIDQSSAIALVNNNSFQMPKCASCAANGKDVLLDDGLYLFTDKGEDRITFSSVSLAAITSDHLNWDAGILPALGLEYLKNGVNQYVPTPDQKQQVVSQIQRTLYLDAIRFESANSYVLDTSSTQGALPEIQPNIILDCPSNPAASKDPLEKPVNFQIITPVEESIIIRLLMNPTERKLWGRMYGLPDDEDARALARSDDFKSINVLDYTIDSPEEDYPNDDPPKGDPKNNCNGVFTMSDNEIEFERDEKVQSGHPSRLMFSTLFEKEESKPEVEENRDDPDKFGMKVVIGDVKPRKKKAIKRKQESALVPPKLLDLLNRNKRAEKQKEQASKETKPNGLKKPLTRKRITRPNNLPPSKNIKDSRFPDLSSRSKPRKKTAKELKDEKKLEPNKPEKKKGARSERPKLAKRDMVVLGGSPFAAVSRPKPVTSMAKAKKIDKDYKLSWMLDKNGNKFKNAKRERKLR